MILYSISNLNLKSHIHNQILFISINMYQNHLLSIQIIFVYYFIYSTYLLVNFHIYLLILSIIKNIILTIMLIFQSYLEIN